MTATTDPAHDAGQAVDAAPVFVSFASDDLQFASELLGAVEAAGIKCWICYRDIPPSVPWSGAIVRAIVRSRALLLVLTAAANTSPNVYREVELAHKQGIQLVPVVVTGVTVSPELDYFVSAIQRIASPPAFDPAVAARVISVLAAGPAPTALADPRTVDRRARELSKPEDATLWRIYASTPTRVVLGAYYALTFVMASVRIPPALIEALAHGLAFSAGAAFVLVSRRVNLLVLFTVGLAQPVVAIVPFMFIVPDLVLHYLTLSPPLSYGAACAAGGLLGSLPFGMPSVQALSPRVWLAWVKPRWTMLRASDKLETAFRIILLLLSLVFVWFSL